MQAGPGVLPVKQWTAGEPPADYLITGFSLITGRREIGQNLRWLHKNYRSLKK